MKSQFYYIIICTLIASYGRNCVSLIIHPENKVASTSKKYNRKQNHKFKTVDQGLDTIYGVPLPSFAFDYSQFILSAMIERSINNTIYLNFIVIDHQSIYENYPFEYISTEVESLYKWKQAVNVWTNITNIRKNRVNHKLQTTRPRRGPFGKLCVLSHNDPEHLVAYTSPAQVVFSSATTPSSNQKNYSQKIFVLRCRLKGSKRIYANLSQTPRFLSVDLINANQIRIYSKVRKSQSINTSSNNAKIRISQAIVPVVNLSTHAYDLSRNIISFSVPWRTRVAGYGYGSNFRLGSQVQIDSINPWKTLSTSGNIVIHACLSAILDSSQGLNTDGGVFRLLLLLEHYLTTLKIQHVFIGVLYDWGSIQITRLKKLLSYYLASGNITIISYSLPGYDNIAGFEGMAVHPSFSDDLFLNQCLCFSKGTADYILVLNTKQFIVQSPSYGELAQLVANQLQLKAKKSHSPIYLISHSVHYPSNRSIFDDAIALLPTIGVCQITSSTAVSTCTSANFTVEYVDSSKALVVVIDSEADLLSITAFSDRAAGWGNSTTVVPWVLPAVYSSLRVLLQSYIRGQLMKLRLNATSHIKRVTQTVLFEAEPMTLLPRGYQELKRPFWLHCHVDTKTEGQTVLSEVFRQFIR